jgi:hypothetical protein
MGNFSLEFPESNYNSNVGDDRGKMKDEMVVPDVTKVKSCGISMHLCQRTDFPSKCNTQIKELPPKHPTAKRMYLGHNKGAIVATNIKNNSGKEEKQRSRYFFRRNRSTSLDVVKSNKNGPTNIESIELSRRSNDAGSSTEDETQSVTSNSKRTFMSGLISPRFSRHLPFSSKRGADKCDKRRASVRAKSAGYDVQSSKLPTHRENLTICTNTRKSGDLPQVSTMSSFGNSCSSMQSLSSIDSQQSGFYSQSSATSYQRNSKCFVEQGLVSNRNHSYTNVPRDPTIFGPRRTSNGRNNYENYNSNLFLNINQGKIFFEYFLNLFILELKVKSDNCKVDRISTLKNI